MYETHDKKIAGNRQLVEAYDKGHGKKSKHMSDAKKADHSTEHEHGGGGGDMKSVVAEHGKAHTHTITHDGSGMHHSETHHEDGHVEHADHGSLEEAHAHGLEAMGDDAEHAEMDMDDAKVAGEENDEEMHHGKTEHVGFM